MLPPPVSSTAEVPNGIGRPARTARNASRLSSSPGITSTSTPVRRATSAQNVVTVAGHPETGGSDRGEGDHVVRPRLLGHPGDGGHGPLQRLTADRAALDQPLAEARELGPVDQHPPAAFRRSLGDVELDGVRTAVDDGVALGYAVDDARKAHRIRGVHVVRQPERADDADDGIRILGLDGERPAL